MADRITEIRIEGMRTIESLRLPLDGLTVLIGPNASGKSTILEALEILRRLPSEGFFNDLHQIHGGPSSWLRQGARRLRLGIRLEGGGPPIDCQVGLELERGSAAIVEEVVDVGPMPGHIEPLHVVRRERASSAVMFSQEAQKLVPVQPRADQLVLVMYRHLPVQQQAFDRLIPLLERISVQPAFEVTSAWAGRAMGRLPPIRSSLPIQPADRLLPTGVNLANAYHALKNGSDKEWQRTLEWLRLGLGDEIETVNAKPDPGGGSISLAIKYAGLDREVWASSLSEGTLAFLALVACIRLDNARSLLAFDEPDLHLHPLLVSRVVQYLEVAAEKHPVLVATHSDRLLDALEDPAKSVVLCELDHERKTVLSRPNREELDRWLERFSGYGELRAAGHEQLVMERPDPS